MTNAYLTDAPARGSVLFVDDDPSVLNILRRTLGPLNGGFTAECASSGQEALAVLAAMPCDLVLSDMHMPGMDGAELLDAVRQLYPGTVRIILSGQADHRGLVRAAGSAHQCLMKPCSAGAIASTVVHALHVQARFRGPACASTAGLPMLPRLRSALDDALQGGGDVASIVAGDPGCAAKLLQMANWSHFSGGRQIVDIRDAVSCLGRTVIGEVLRAGQLTPMAPAATSAAPAEGFWSRAQATSTLAAAIARAESCSPRDVAAAASGGLLHDIGALVPSSPYPSGASDEPSGIGHADASADLLRLWGIPHEIVQAVEEHHRPRLMADRPFTASDAVFVATRLVESGDDIAVLASMGDLFQSVSAGRLPDWLRIQNSLREAARGGEGTRTVARMPAA